MKLLIVDNYEELSELAAELVCQRINAFVDAHSSADDNDNKANHHRKLFTLGLPTGSTPLGMYRHLVAMHEAGRLSFSRVRTFNMDEYVGISRDHSQSYHSFMFNNFFRHIDIDPTNVHIPNGMASNLQEECARYEREIGLAGGIDLFVSGIGSDGHMAFNEPGSSLTSRTRVQTLNTETIVANSRFFSDDPSRVPKQALTVGVGTIVDAREVLMLVNGAHKAVALRAALEKGVSHMCTASALQLHPNSVWLVDEEATLELRVKTVKYWKEQREQNITLLGLLH